MVKFKVEVEVYSSLGPPSSNVNVIEMLNLFDHCSTPEKREQYC